jgi:hypothetical protein
VAHRPQAHPFRRISEKGLTALLHDATSPAQFVPRSNSLPPQSFRSSPDSQTTCGYSERPLVTNLYLRDGFRRSLLNRLCRGEDPQQCLLTNTREPPIINPPASEHGQLGARRVKVRSKGNKAQARHHSCCSTGSCSLTALYVSMYSTSNYPIRVCNILAEHPSLVSHLNRPHYTPPSLAGIG